MPRIVITQANLPAGMEMEEVKQLLNLCLDTWIANRMKRVLPAQRVGIEYTVRQLMEPIVIEGGGDEP